MKLVAAAMFVSVLAANAPAAAAPPSPAEEWPAYGHDSGEARFSPLAQITPANVAGLKPVWTYHMRPPTEPGARPRGFAASQNTPLVVGGVMYLSTPYGRVVALDAETCAQCSAEAAPGSSIQGAAAWPSPQLTSNWSRP